MPSDYLQRMAAFRSHKHHAACGCNAQGKKVMAKKRNRKGTKGGGGGGRRRKRSSGGSGGKRRRSRHAVPVRVVNASGRRPRRRARAAAAAAAPRRRRRHHGRAAAAETRYRRRRRHGRKNPFSGGELAFAVGTGALGFIATDALDRFLATYDPSKYGGTGASLPTDRFTGGNGTQANTLNIAAQPSIMRLGAAIAMAAVPLIGASMIKSSLARSALQGFGLGASIKTAVLIWNGYVVPKVFAPAAGANPTATSLPGLRLYPAEIVASENLTASPQGGINGQPFNPGLARKPAQAAPAKAPAMLAAAPVDVGPVAAAPQSVKAAPAPAPTVHAPPAKAGSAMTYLGFLSST